MTFYEVAPYEKSALRRLALDDQAVAVVWRKRAALCIDALCLGASGRGDLSSPVHARRVPSHFTVCSP
jgi:hypothetical protein